MNRSLQSDTTRIAVIIIDRMKLRRAGVVSLLQPWARAVNVSVVEALPGTSLRECSAGTTCALAIVSLGGEPVDSPEAKELFDSVRAQLPDTPLVIISDRDHPEEAVSAFQIGVRGFIPTNSDPAIACQAFTFIMGGGWSFPPAALLCEPRSTERTATATAGRADGETAAPAGLTVRQQEVLDLLRLGKSNKLIARDLRMQEATVKVHVRQIMRKLGAANRTQAALLAAAQVGSGAAASGTPSAEAEGPLRDSYGASCALVGARLAVRPPPVEALDH